MVRPFKLLSITYGHVVHLRRIYAYKLRFMPAMQNQYVNFWSVTVIVKPIEIYARISTREFCIHYKSYFQAPFLRYCTFEESAFRRSIRANKNLRCIKRWKDCQHCRGKKEECPHHNSVQPLSALNYAKYSANYVRNNVYFMSLNLWVGPLNTKKKATQKRQLYSIAFLRYALLTNCRQLFAWLSKPLLKHFQIFPGYRVSNVKVNKRFSLRNVSH